MMRIDEITNKMAEVSNFQWSVEELRKAMKLHGFSLMFNGHPSTSVYCNDGGVALALRESYVKFCRDRVELRAALLRQSNVDPGDWKKEFDK
jgi:hypothetical protein